MKLLECVPNVSEGRDTSLLDLFSRLISAVPGIKLLHRDVGLAANRSVYTFIGEGEAVVEAAAALYRITAERLDMRHHRGTHPRQGLVDVCPLIPLGGMSMEEAVKFSRQLAEMIGNDPGIPGYFYERSALPGQPHRLEILRKGEYEGIAAKLKEMPPQFGRAANWPRYGLTVLGARPLLIAYNVNLNTRDVSVARAIAARLRESGQLMLREDGRRERVHGKLKSVKGLGWYIEDFQKAQVSFNLTDLSHNGILDVFEACVEEAEKLNFKVTGSELIGLAPLSEFEKVNTALGHAPATLQWDKIIAYLGLSELKEFRPREKVIEYLTQDLKFRGA